MSFRSVPRQSDERLHIGNWTLLEAALRRSADVEPAIAAL
jgi:hypothetical protein